MVGRRRNPYAALEKEIGHRFRKRALLESALMHRSFRFENRNIGDDNQRLEFLGDAVLGFVSAAYVYSKFEDKDEGVLTSFRSQISSGRALARVAKSIELGKYIKMGKGEELSGGRKRSSNLADALEAIIGAAYLDGDMKAVNKVFKRLFVPRLDSLTDVWAGNPKGKLQEYSQRTWRSSPKYRTVRREGPAHATVFTVEVTLPDGTVGRGKGRNKQHAEAEAAIVVLQGIRMDTN